MKEKVVLLLGGEDKSLNFSPIFEKYVSKIDIVIAFGSARNKIIKTVRNFKEIEVKCCKYFSDAVKTACEYAKENTTVLLSPACTSFDEFSDYAERGEVFAKIVKRYVDAKN
jgi:UDP-N-acetylmuramoylalanine--D-glutamate ligase